MALELDHEGLLAFARHLRSIGLWWIGRTSEAVELAREAADAFARLDRIAESCEARKFQGVALVLDGDPDRGLAIQQDVLATMRNDVGGPLAAAHGLAYLGHCHRFVGDDVAAEADWHEAADLYRAVENRGTAIHVEIGLAEIATDGGDFEAALAHVSRALDLCDAAGLPTYVPWAWTAASRVHAQTGDVESALACARRAAALLHATPTGEAVRLASELAALTDAIGDRDTAARLVGFAGATLDRRELPFPSAAERRRHAALADRLRADAPDSVHAGSRCTFTEAAGSSLRADARSRT
jgi:tetratricopeptide (TPR) repeat protein